MNAINAAFRKLLKRLGLTALPRWMLALALAINTGAGAAIQNWSRFRGPNGSGVSEARDLPVELGTVKNLAWRTEVPAGRSSPVVWENRVFLTGYAETRCLVVCIELANGKHLWERTIEGGAGGAEIQTE